MRGQRRHRYLCPAARPYNAAHSRSDSCSEPQHRLAVAPAGAQLRRASQMTVRALGRPPTRTLRLAPAASAGAANDSESGPLGLHIAITMSRRS